APLFGQVEADEEDEVDEYGWVPLRRTSPVSVRATARDGLGKAERPGAVMAHLVAENYYKLLNATKWENGYSMRLPY
ncbi:MAG: hypothetical protein ACTSXX_03505, partial [Candidatus Baldrarchaeia archaeon]